MITNLLIACALMVWDPSTNATSYDIYEDMIYSATVTPPEIGICRVAYYTSSIYYVVGINAGGESTPSEPLEVQWVADADFDDNGFVGFADFGSFSLAFLSTSSEHDLDGNGTVGFSDFGLFTQRFGKCNDGVIEVPCP